MEEKEFNHYSLTWLYLLPVIFIIACSKNDPLDLWRLDIPIYGSNSSPKCIDLNHDGVMDIVFGLGKNEHDYSEMGVLALDGKTGNKLWSVDAKDQVYGSPIFQDVNSDGTPDVFITGRTQNLMCIDGGDGHIIWKYKLESRDYNPLGLARFNFYNPRFLKDYDDDNLEDLLVLNSGNIAAQPYDTSQRYPGVLMVISAGTGKILALDTVPDGKESYMSPVVHDFDHDGDLELVFGTGGETVSGNLFVVPLSDLIENNLSGARKLLASDNQHGFVAPPLIVDFDKDGFKDLLVVNHGGVVTLLDGKNNLIVKWEVSFNELELNSMATTGNFNGDEYPDVFINGVQGQWPENTGSENYFIDGLNGQIIRKYVKGCSGFSSPITINMDQTGLDEVLLFVNEYDCEIKNILSARTSLYVFGEDEPQLLREINFLGKNISSTLWAGDLDGDDRLDIISMVYKNVSIMYEFLGMQVQRDEFNINPKNIVWGEYMGPGNVCTKE